MSDLEEQLNDDLQNVHRVLSGDMFEVNFRSEQGTETMLLHPSELVHKHVARAFGHGFSVELGGEPVPEDVTLQELGVESGITFSVIANQEAWTWDPSANAAGALDQAKLTITTACNNFQPTFGTRGFSSGVHTWVVRINAQDMALGVATQDCPRNTWIGEMNQPACRAFSYSALAIQSNTLNTAKFPPGERITVELTLDCDDHTLSLAFLDARIDDAEPFEILPEEVWYPIAGGNSKGNQIELLEVDGIPTTEEVLCV